MGLGPHPVERARSGGAEGARGPLKRPPPALRPRTASPHMSGVGAPAIRPRNSVRPRKSGPGHGPGYMSGVGAPAVRPRPVARARKRPPWPPACEPPQRRIIRPRTMAGG
eukprot:gene20577-biopygen20614